MAVKPLTAKIADLALDALIVAHQVQCPIRRETLTDALSRINRKADRLHAARKAARAIEDNGAVSPWTERQLREMQRVGDLEEVERSPKPRQLRAG